MAASTRRTVPPAPFAHFLTHDEIREYADRLAAARPELCRVESLGVSREGREIPLLVLTDFSTGVPEDRPAYLIHANIHASEVAGTHLALYTARRLVTRDRALLQHLAFYIVPRLNPDGAEFAVTTGGAIRSRIDRSEPAANALYPADVDGDGWILSMRQQHPDGAFVRDPEDPRLLIRRRATSRGPFYRVLPEGLIHDWDGTDHVRLGGRSLDWNRNWSYDWRPEPEQPGSGDFPFSEPEMRALGEFLHSRPNIFGILGYHTGAAAVLRPPSTGSDADLPESDVRVLEDLARHGAQATGFPVVPVIKYHRSWQRDIHLHGHFHDFGYHHLGMYVFEFELGTARDSAGIDTAQQFGVFAEEEAEAHMRQVMKWWDRSGRKHPLFQPWKRFRHPQLGPVEIGGFLSCGLANQTLERLRTLARGTHAFTVEHAGRHPRVVVEDLRAERIGEDLWRVRARIANRGEFPTHVSARGAGLRRLRPVEVTFHPTGQLLSQQGHFTLGHLAGITGSRALEWFVRADQESPDLGKLTVRGGTGGNTVLAIRG